MKQFYMTFLLSGLLCLMGTTALAATAANTNLTPIVDTLDVVDWIQKWTGSELYPSEFGPAGWPGKDSELIGMYGYRGNNWGWPEVIPYPGSVEHTRVAKQRYMPMYPIHHARTLVKAFRCAELPEMDEARIVEYAEPVYRVPKYCYPKPEDGIFSDAIKLGKYRKPVNVVRFDQNHPPIELDLGTLPESAYVVRVIAATDSERVQQSTKRLVIHFEVNDGLKGEWNAYKKRTAANDQFYSIVEFYFMAPTEREYSIRLRIDGTSELPLYVHTIDVHDRLAQVANRAGKKTASFYLEDERAAKWKEAGGPKLDTRTRKERLQGDLDQWSALPAINAQPKGGGRYWSNVVGSVLKLPPDAVDDGMGIDVYGSDMIWNLPKKSYKKHRSAGSYEIAADAGLYWQLQRQTYYGKASEIELQMRKIRHAGLLDRDVKRYDTSGDEAAARRAAIRLAMRAKMNLLNMDGFRQSMVAIDCIPELSWNQGDLAFRRRRASFYGQLEKVDAYDKVFPYIRGNTELAESLGRFIPWIRNVDDMIKFYDVGLLQLPAHDTLSYQRHNNYESGAWMTWYIGAQQDREIVEPWKHWLFRYVWAYPRTPAGVDEVMFMSWNRDGTTICGSTYYAHTSITSLRDTLKNLTPVGEDPHTSLPPQINLPELFSRAEWESRFSQDIMVAGGYRFWIGDVGGPSRTRHVATGGNEPKIDAKNKSRVMSSWCGVLETNVEEDDFRKRRAVGLRVGWGVGHAHNDPLDLQMWSLGVPLSGDWGGRKGYCNPSVSSLGSHNLVVARELLKGKKHSWISSIVDSEGARYLMGQVKCDGFYGRQLTLIDTDDPVPNSYVVDIFRIRGGDKPAYAFHGPPPDEFITNIEKIKKGYPNEMESPSFDPDHNWHGTIASHLTASWRMSREPQSLEWQPKAKKKKKTTSWFGFSGTKPEKMAMKIRGAEPQAMGKDYDASDPRKHIRLHLVGHEGATAYGRRGYGLMADKFYNDMLYVSPAKWEGQTVFPVVFEPYGDEKIVRSVKLLTEPESVNNYAAPIALEIKLRNQRRDVVYTALRDSDPVTIAGLGRVQGEYAFVSYDAKGLRQATLVGGITLKTDDIVINTARSAYEGTVLGGVASEKKLVLTGQLPKSAEGSVMETGPADRRTSYTIKSINGKTVTMHKDFALAMTRVSGFLKEDGMPFTHCKIYSDSGVPVSNEKGDTWWTLGAPYELKREEKAWPDGGTAHPSEVPPRGKALRLIGDTMPQKAMKKGERIWVREVGVGNAYRLPIYVNVIRREDGHYEVQSNVDAKVTVAGKVLTPVSGAK